MIKNYNNLNRIISGIILASYLVMTGIIDFHHHGLDINTSSTKNVTESAQGDIELSSLPFSTCLFIHHTSNTIQFFEQQPDPVGGITCMSFVYTTQENQFSLQDYHYFSLRAPPSFS